MLGCEGSQFTIDSVLQICIFEANLDSVYFPFLQSIIRDQLLNRFPICHTLYVVVQAQHTLSTFCTKALGVDESRHCGLKPDLFDARDHTR